MLGFGLAPGTYSPWAVPVPALLVSLVFSHQVPSSLLGPLLIAFLCLELYSSLPVFF